MAGRGVEVEWRGDGGVGEGGLAGFFISSCALPAVLAPSTRGVSIHPPAHSPLMRMRPWPAGTLWHHALTSGGGLSPLPVGVVRGESNGEEQRNKGGRRYASAWEQPLALRNGKKKNCPPLASDAIPPPFDHLYGRWRGG